MEYVLGAMFGAVLAVWIMRGLFALIERMHR